MKQILLKIIKVYGSWLNKFSSSFAATLCGIMLTFGIGHYNSICKKEKFVRTSEVVAMYSIKTNISQFESKIKKLQEKDSIISEVMALYPDSIEYCSKSLCGEFCSSLFSFDYYGFDDNSDKLFNSNANIWDDADDISAIFLINDLFLQVNNINGMITELNNKISDIGNRCLPQAIIDNKDHIKALKVFLDDKNNVLMLGTELPMKLQLLELSLQCLKKMNAHAIKKLNITQEEFNKLNVDFEFKIKRKAVW